MSETPFSGRRALIADDEPSVQFVTQRMLEKNGFEVETAGDGAEAVQRLQDSGPFDLLLLDVSMPGQTCRQTLEAARSIAPEQVIVLCSGFSGAEDEVQGAQQHVQGFLQKPFRYQELLDVIADVLS